MGQWLKAIGGYTVERIGEHRPSRSTLLIHAYIIIRFLSIRNDGICYRLDTRVRHMDRSYAGAMACFGIHVYRVYRFRDMHLGLEQSGGSEILCVLYVTFRL